MNEAHELVMADIYAKLRLSLIYQAGRVSDARLQCLSRLRHGVCRRASS